MDEKKQNDQIQLFEDQKIRTAWDAEQEEWHFSVVDVVGTLTGQSTPRGASTYWAVLKKRLKEEGENQLLTNCKQLKMTAADGKKQLINVAGTERLRWIIQSIPSPKAELFKLLARLAVAPHTGSVEGNYEVNLVDISGLENGVAQT